MNPSLRTHTFRHRFFAIRALLISVGFLTWVHAQEPTARSAQEWLGSVVGKLIGMIEPGARDLPQTVSATVRILEAEGFGNGLAGQTMDVAFQAPDRLRVSARVQGRELHAGRFGQELWIYAPATRFGVVGSSEVPRFGTRPDSVDRSVLPPFDLPVAREQFLVLPLLLQLELLPPESVGGTSCQVLRATPFPQATAVLKLPQGELRLWIRESDSLPVRIGFTDDSRRVLLELEPLKVGEPWPDAAWRLQPGADSKVERVARAHLERFFPAAFSLLDLKIPTLGPATGEKRVLAVEGDGRLEDHDGTKVLFLRGTPEEMGRQHGILMRREVRDLVSKILYGIGVGSSFEKGRWFFGEIEEAQARTAPFVDERHLREMDAIALAAGLDREEVRLANFFPELFHCSGFAVFGRATADGRLYHGRILDYLRGVGLEPNAVVIVHQPDVGYPWVNVSYGGFVGSVTAMNARQLSIGEMGGRGEGLWDGKPMAQLVREVMEKAGTLDEAIEIMRQGPRTCEYYYVIADGKSRDAVGIAATPTLFEVVRPGQAHPRLPHAIPDAVVLSAGDRYEQLAQRVQSGFGRFDAESARRLMDRPVAMKSNIHSVLFAPETLDFWVANADSSNVASHCRYTHYNLAALGVGVGDSPSPPPAEPEPVTISAGTDWIPLQPELEIEPGSALDFSAMGFVDAPAGKHGRVIARPDGQFAFEHLPDVPQRFYGVNLCFGAHYVTHAEADRLAERLVRLGYNALRIHHHERDLVRGQADSTTPDSQRLDQFDYLMAALIRRGIYLTTDIYVSRPVPWREVGIDRDGQIPMDTFKILVPVHEGAFENWKAFARNLLGHTNPYTGRRYAEEPALAWLAMINEGNFGNFFNDLRSIPEWTAAWNRWLATRYQDQAALHAAWGAELLSDESVEQGNVGLPDNLRAAGPRARDCVAFLSDTERAMVQRMKRFLRDELGCRALVSNANSWTYFVTDQSAREVYDYVDDHFYVDHPRFLEQPWRLPSRCPNTSPIAEGATGGRSKAFTRLFDKPFTITEYNYSGPGRFRGVGGILTGALGALQGWDGIWRFAYSHSREAMFTPSRMGYFDLAGDPLSQAAERASLCLFLRGDLQSAPRRLALVMTEADLAHAADRIPGLHPRWHWTAWLTQVGTDVLQDPAEAATYTAFLPLGWKTVPDDYPAPGRAELQPYSADDDQIMQWLRAQGILQPANPTHPAQHIFRSETGEITIDGARDILVLDTPRTAGGYAPEGQTVEAPQAGMRVTMRGTDATLWVSALDDQPIATSRRLLVTHLTDLQNTAIRYAEPERRTLLDWGRLPHLVRAGTAEVRLRIDQPERYRVWALAPTGRRLAEVPATRGTDFFQFTAAVAADPESGARMLYEIAPLQPTP